ncbi:hypothetical protein EV424DRAFT_1121774 [Suillus variegatus]|nr:hypothetical protein EV424DRAFT_1121774 [Suillus variegatus]
MVTISPLKQHSETSQSISPKLKTILLLVAGSQIFGNAPTLIVAVKVLQVCADDQFGPAKTKKTKRIMHELRICANLKHANVVPIYGYTYGFGPFPAIVSRWAEEGNLSDYLKREGVALTLLRKFRILRDIIAGLQYRTC